MGGGPRTRRIGAMTPHWPSNRAYYFLCLSETRFRFARCRSLCLPNWQWVVPPHYIIRTEFRLASKLKITGQNKSASRDPHLGLVFFKFLSIGSDVLLISSGVQYLTEMAATVVQCCQGSQSFELFIQLSPIGYSLRIFRNGWA